MMKLLKYLIITGIMSLVTVAPALADIVSADFESPNFGPGSVNNQDGWKSAVGVDQAVVTNTFGFDSFGSQSWRISNAFTSDDPTAQTFARSLINPVGESTAVGTISPCGTRQTHFEMSFDISSATSSAQPGLSLVVAPASYGGQKMSYLRFEDQQGGIEGFFIYYFFGRFIPTQFGVDFDRFSSRNIKLTIDVNESQPYDDVVTVYVNNQFVLSAFSWEGYYPFPPLINTVMFETSGIAADTVGKGFIIDNLIFSSPGDIVSGPTDKSQCKKDGWQQLPLFSQFGFKNQGECVSYVIHHPFICG